MALFKVNNLKLNYNPSFNRISITSGDEFISITLRSFELFMLMIKTPTAYDRIITAQSGSELEIIQLCNNFVFRFQSSRNLTNYLIIKAEDAKSIFDSQFNILNSIKKRKQIYFERRENIGDSKILRKFIDSHDRKKMKLNVADVSRVNVSSEHLQTTASDYRSTDINNQQNISDADDESGEYIFIYLTLF